MHLNLSNVVSDTFCIAPWVNLHISQKNQIKPCCGGRGIFESIENYTAGNDNNLNQLKQDLLDGKSTSFCDGCVEKEWYSEFLDQDLKVDKLEDFILKSVDARWGVTCQLSCMYCNSNFSSTWRQLESKTIPIQPFKIYDDNITEIFKLIDSNRNQLTRVSMLGGEPLLLKENLRLLDAINENTSIEIFTNLNVDLDKNEIFQKLITRKNVNWYVSMETIGQRFEFVRRGADWNLQVQNLQQLTSKSTSPVILQSQYCVYNALNLVELYDFANTFKNLTINLTSGVTKPAVLNFFLFPEPFKILALDQVNQCINTYPDMSYHLIKIKDLLESSMTTSTTDILNECIKWHQEQETKYFKNRFDFLELWPEYLVK